MKKGLMNFLIIVLSVIMISMAIISFVCGEPKYILTTNIVYIFVIIALFLVFDAVESLSIGNVVSLNKKVKEKENEIEKLSEENINLRNQVFSIIKGSFNNQNSFQLFWSDNAKNGFEIKSAQKDDFNNGIEKDNESDEVKTEEIVNNRPQNIINNRIRFGKTVKEYLINRYIIENNIDEGELLKEIKITGALAKSDPIINRDSVFEAYIKRTFDELFIESVGIVDPHIVYDNRFYFQISRIYHYSHYNNVKAKMVLLLPIYQEKYVKDNPELFRNRDPKICVRKIKEIYSPAIENGLLEIIEINISEDDLEFITSQLT